MNKAPKVGSRVKYKGSLVVGPCVGTVLHVYPQNRYAPDTDWEDDSIPRIIGLEPESKWHVRLKVDSIPTPWAYDQDGVFAPEVSKLTPVITRARTDDTTRTTPTCMGE
jgi:hypothetical protein